MERMKRLIAIGCAALAAATCAFGRDTAIYNGKLTSDLNANGNAVTSLKEPSADSDAATKKYVDAATADAGKVQSVNGKTGAVELAASDVGAVATNDFSAATNALATTIAAKANAADVYKKSETYSQAEINTKVANATPGDYAAVSNAAMTALQPAATNGLVTASVTNGLASAASVAQEAKDRAAAIATKADATNVYSKSEIDAKGYLTAHQSLADYAKTATLNSYSNELATAIANSAPADYANVSNKAVNAAQASALAKVATSGSYADLSNKPTIPTVPTKVSAFSNDSGYITQTTADSSYYPKASGDAWSSYWDGDDVRVTVTNFDSTAHLPSLYLEQRTNSTASASSDTNAFRVVWRELAHWDAFLGSTWNWEDATWQGFDEWRTSLSSQLDDKADRAWGFYDSHTGKYAPDGYTSISSSNVMICAGASYQKTATATCDVWVLTANEPYEPTGVSTNGGFQIKDADGNVQFEIVKGDKRTVKAQANATSVENNTTLVVTYAIVADSAPTGEVCLDLKSAAWKSETDSDCPATVTWSGSSGAWVARITPKSSSSTCFFKATYQVGGDTYVNNRCAVGMSQLVLDGTTYNLGTATIDGHTVLTLTPAN